MVWRTQSVKPSAQPTLVRTQHLPPPAKTARGLGFLRVRGPSGVVSSCVIGGQQTPLRGSGYGHMADGFGPEQAVHRTACSGILMVQPALSAAARQPGNHRVIPRIWLTQGPRAPGIGAAPVLAPDAGPEPRIAGATGHGILHRDTSPKADHTGPDSAGAVAMIDPLSAQPAPAVTP
jgi:hypothetical protein